MSVIEEVSNDVYHLTYARCVSAEEFKRGKIRHCYFGIFVNGKTDQTKTKNSERRREISENKNEFSFLKSFFTLVLRTRYSHGSGKNTNRRGRHPKNSLRTCWRAGIVSSADCPFWCSRHWDRAAARTTLKIAIRVSCARDLIIQIRFARTAKIHDVTSSEIGKSYNESSTSNTTVKTFATRL